MRLVKSMHNIQLLFFILNHDYIGELGGVVNWFYKFGRKQFVDFSFCGFNFFI